MRSAAPLLAALVALAGCERPLVDPLDVDLQLVSPDLSEVRTTSVLALELRALRAVPGATLRIAGQPASYDTTRGVYQDTLALAPGLNALPVEIADGETVVARDTLYALFLDVQAVPATEVLAVAPRAGATATELPGETLLAGGMGTSEPLATTTRVARTGLATAGTLAVARAGHAAVRLPSGETLLLGGATALAPTSASQFVPTAELLSPAGVSLGEVNIAGGPFRRAGHTTRLLVAPDGRVTIYAYGGWDGAAGDVRETGTVAILEWTPDRRLALLTPPDGAGSFGATRYAAQIDLPEPPFRSVVLDGAPPDGRAFRFEWRAPGINYPFDLRATAATPLFRPRRAATVVDVGAVADVGGALVLVVGGTTPGGDISDAIEAYAPEADRAFRFPDGVRLSIPRAHASATILSGRRIAIVGGLGPAGRLASPPEVFTF